jgi:hypothetical protein
VVNAGAGRVESPAPGSTLGYFSVVVSIVLTLVTLHYVRRVDTDTTVAAVLFFGACLAVAVALWAVAATTGPPARRVGAAACVVSTGLLFVSRLASEDGTGGGFGNVNDWPVAGTTGAAVLAVAAWVGPTMSASRR